MGKKLIGLENLKKIFKIVKIENGIVYLKLHKGRYIIRVELPFKANEKLASLFGHILGDGCIKTKEENVYYTNKSKDLIEEFKATIKELFRTEVKENFNNSTREFYEVYPPKTIAKFLVLCGFPKGEKTKQAIIIPDWIKEGSNEIKVAFIRALFDDDSIVINSKRNFVISFGMNKRKSLLEPHKVFIGDVRKIFSLGIYPNEIFERKQPGDFIQLGFHIYMGDII